LLENIKMVAPDDQRISKAHVEFEVSRRRWGIGCDEDYEPDDWCMQQDREAGRKHMGTCSWWCSLGIEFLISREVWPLLVVPGNGESLFVSLLKPLSGIYSSFFGLKTYNLLIRRWQCVCALFPSWRRCSWRAFFVV
jgi:hypothetical protein